MKRTDPNIPYTEKRPYSKQALAITEACAARPASFLSIHFSARMARRSLFSAARAKFHSESRAKRNRNCCHRLSLEKFSMETRSDGFNDASNSARGALHTQSHCFFFRA